MVYCSGTSKLLANFSRVNSTHPKNGLLQRNDAQKNLWHSRRAGDGSSSSPDEAFVTRWIIVTDKRMLHAQEEPGWGADKEKVKTLDLAR